MARLRKSEASSTDVGRLCLSYQSCTAAIPRIVKRCEGMVADGKLVRSQPYLHFVGLNRARCCPVLPDPDARPPSTAVCGRKKYSLRIVVLLVWCCYLSGWESPVGLWDAAPLGGTLEAASHTQARESLKVKTAVQHMKSTLFEARSCVLLLPGKKKISSQFLVGPQACCVP